MRSFVVTISVLLLRGALVTPHEVGINCDGSDMCDVFEEELGSIFDNQSKHIDRSGIYLQGSKIICNKGDGGAMADTGLCLFPQKANISSQPGLFDGTITLKNGTMVRGINGSLFLDGLTKLIDHRCDFCGSVPIATGMLLTSNYVFKTGACKQIKGTSVCQPDINATNPLNPYFNPTTTA